jgi:methyltransferase (TIGR00027 family)
MADGLIQDVSDTAFMVATYRAMETERSDALFRDPLAGKLAGTHGVNIVANMRRNAAMGKWFVVIRTCVIDDLIRNAVAEGVDTVLNLGAGLDTRPYRLSLPQSLRWIEIDYPRIIELKESRLASEKPRCRLERIKLDLTDVERRRRVFSEIAGQSEKVLVLTEGVVPYLTTEEAGSLADDLRTQPAFRYWIVDYLAPSIRMQRERAAKAMKMENARFRFQPPDYYAFFEEHGWRPKDIRYIAEEGLKLNRPPELPLFFLLWFKLASLFMSKRRRDAFRKAAAYVLFEPSEKKAQGAS